MRFRTRTGAWPVVKLDQDEQAKVILDELARTVTTPAQRSGLMAQLAETYAQRAAACPAGESGEYLMSGQLAEIAALAEGWLAVGQLDGTLPMTLLGTLGYDPRDAAPLTPETIAWLVLFTSPIRAERAGAYRQAFAHAAQRFGELAASVLDDLADAEATASRPPAQRHASDLAAAVLAMSRARP